MKKQMKIQILCLLLSLSGFNYAFAQQENGILSGSTHLKNDSITLLLSDTTFVSGKVKVDSSVGDTVNSFGDNGIDELLKEGTKVLVSGIKKCRKEGISKDFFEVIYNNKKYYIEKEKLDVQDFSFEIFDRLSDEQANLYRAKVLKASQDIYLMKLKVVFDFIDACKLKGLVIMDWKFYDESKYTEGTSVKIDVLNPTDKTIKYIWFTFQGLNPVGDKVFEYRSKSFNVIRKAVGPIDKDNIGSYEFSYVWMTDIVEKVLIASIKIQYMDGTFKTINSPKNIMLTKNQKELILNKE